MTNPNEITPEGMRRLLLALGGKDPYKTLNHWDWRGMFGPIDHFVNNAHHRADFVLACAEFLESEAVRKVAYVNTFNQEGVEGGRDEPAHFIFRKGGHKFVQMVTGPFARRVVKAAAVVAETGLQPDECTLCIEANAKKGVDDEERDQRITRHA